MAERSCFLSEPSQKQNQQPASTEHEEAAPVPLTRLSLSSLKPAKRKAPVETRPRSKRTFESLSPTEDEEEEEEEEEVTRYAPPKRARRVKEKTLENKLGFFTNNYRSSTEYTAGLVSNPQLLPSDIAALQYVNYLIAKCITEGTEVRMNELRNLLHEMEVDPKYTGQLVKATPILSPAGLPRIFSYTGFPWDIKTDAAVLYQRWSNNDFDSSLLRGIQIDKSKGTHYKVEEAYRDARGITASVMGENGLTNGQWWPKQMCAFRDGAHGEREAGIHGKAGIGAFSIVLSSGYADKDLGETIHYCGTESRTGTPTARTSFLRLNLLNRSPIRVLRGHKGSVYAPSEGIRYDGLYTITSEELLNRETAMYRFTLQRVPGQDPIRYKGVEKRPTKQQVDEMRRTWATIKGPAAGI